MLRHQTAVEGPGLLPRYPPALAEGALLVCHDAAVTEATLSLCRVLWGRTPALPRGQTVQQAPGAFHPPVPLTGRHLLHWAPLCSPSPAAKLLCTKTEHWGTLLPNKISSTGSYLIKLYLVLQDGLNEQFLLLPVALFASMSLQNTHCSLCGCFVFFLQSLFLHVPAYFYHLPSLP